MRSFDDLTAFDDAVTAFVHGTENWVRIFYAPKQVEALAYLYKLGLQHAVETWELKSSLLDRISRAIATKYQTDGNFQLVRSTNHWRIAYGPCWYYGGTGMPLLQLIIDETERIERIRDDWEPMTEEEISEMMTDD
jgi:hypothetical protein